MTRLLRSLLVLGTTLTLGACGGKTPPPEAPEVETEAVESNDGPELAVSSEIGGMNEEAVTRVFKNVFDDIEKCLKTGAKRIEFLGGEIALFALVDQSGAILHSHIEQSTLGDRETEKCMLAALGTETWPKPVGGEKGEIRKSFSFQPSDAVRPPVDWSADEVTKALEELAEDIDGCKEGVGGAFTATMYVSKAGKPLGIGVAPPSQEGEAVVDCLVGVLQKAKLESPGSWPAKVTFTL